MLSLPWLICGIVNGVLLSFRVTPLSAMDFQIMRVSVLLMYLTPFQRVLLYGAVGIFVIGVIALWIIGPKISGKIHYGKNVASIAGVFLCVVLLVILARSIKAVNDDFGNLAGAYDDYGFVYCFSNSMLDTGIDRPENYDESAIQKITDKLPATINTASKIKPDIILIQLESYMDPKLIKDLTFSDDPAPVHTYLRENFSHGQLAVPSFGGGTANTEFEVLTGISIDNFGPSEYPYKTVILNETCESLAYNLKESGYSAHAIHNHTGNFYDRDKVYPNLGFDSFQSLEYMTDYELTPYGWCKDNILTEEIITALTYTDEKNGIDEDTPRFVWTVSVQGHGKYPTEPIPGEDYVIKVDSSAYSESQLCSLEYYVNQAWEMDMFLGSLISALETREKPTLVIAYGDHLPAIGLDGTHFSSGDEYTTEYVTWNNFGMEKEICNLSTYELSGEFMSRLGFNNGNITKLYQLAKEDVLTEKEYLDSVNQLAYDMLYGKCYQFNGEKPYKTTQMRMGTLPVVAETLRVLDGAIYVQGTGFTEKSSIFINGKKQDTVMLSQYSLMAVDVTISDGDSVSVGQASGKSEVLGYSNVVIYDKEQHYSE